MRSYGSTPPTETIFHHLNRQIPTDVKKLEQRTEEGLVALSEIETDVFGYGFNQGAVVPRLPHHWPIAGDRLVAPTSDRRSERSCYRDRIHTGHLKKVATRGDGRIVLAQSTSS
jgi:hypothetical protein